MDIIVIPLKKASKFENIFELSLLRLTLFLTVLVLIQEPIILFPIDVK